MRVTEYLVVPRHIVEKLFQQYCSVLRSRGTVKDEIEILMTLYLDAVNGQCSSYQTLMSKWKCSRKKVWSSKQRYAGEIERLMQLNHLVEETKWKHRGSDAETKITDSRRKTKLSVTQRKLSGNPEETPKEKQKDEEKERTKEKEVEKTKEKLSFQKENPLLRNGQKKKVLSQNLISEKETDHPWKSVVKDHFAGRSLMNTSSTYRQSDDLGQHAGENHKPTPLKRTTAEMRIENKSAHNHHLFNQPIKPMSHYAVNHRRFVSNTQQEKSPPGRNVPLGISEQGGYARHKRDGELSLREYLERCGYATGDIKHLLKAGTAGNDLKDTDTPCIIPSLSES